MTMKERNDGSSCCYEAAADWFVRLQEPELPTEEWLLWQRWLDENPQNREAFDAIAHTSQLAHAGRSDLLDIAIPSALEREVDAYAGEEPVGDWLAREQRKAAREQGSLGVRSTWPRRFVLAAGLATFALATGLLLRTNSVATDGSAQQPNFQTVESEHRDITLADGSAITLGAKSSLLVNYSRDRRTVTLENGEALFTVAKDPDRPFVVVAGSGTITAIGTAFNVRRDSERVVVTVTEGEVEIIRGAGEEAAIEPVQTKSLQRTSATLTRGHQVVYDATRLNIVEVADPATATAWRAGRLQYRAEPLKYVVADVNRYTARKIVIADKQVEDLRFTGSLFQGQAKEWLEGLEQVFPVEVIEMDDDKVLIREIVPQAR